MSARCSTGVGSDNTTHCPVLYIIAAARVEPHRPGLCRYDMLLPSRDPLLKLEFILKSNLLRLKQGNSNLYCTLSLLNKLTIPGDIFEDGLVGCSEELQGCIVLGIINERVLLYVVYINIRGGSNKYKLSFRHCIKRHVILVQARNVLYCSKSAGD